MGLDSSQGSKLEKDFENYIGAHQADRWGRGGEDRQKIPDGGKQSGQRHGDTEEPVGMLFKCEGGGEMENLGWIQKVFSASPGS